MKFGRNQPRSQPIVRVARLAGDLAQWLDQNPRDSTVIRIALLETALDRYLAERAATASGPAAAAADAHDMMQAVLRRAVQRRRATLQMNTLAITRAAGDPAGDEESANRLADTLNFLDTLAGRVPDHLVSREELAAASEVLALLVGWFAGLPAASARLIPARTSRSLGGAGESHQAFVNGRHGPTDRIARSRGRRGFRQKARGVQAAHESPHGWDQAPPRAMDREDHAPRRLDARHNGSAGARLRTAARSSRRRGCPRPDPARVPPRGEGAPEPAAMIEAGVNACQSIR